MNTPYYLIDEAALRRNLEILRGVRERTGCKILLAQKAFSMFAVYPIIAEYLDGATASGLFEARLAAEELQGENHVFSAAYRAEDIPNVQRADRTRYVSNPDGILSDEAVAHIDRLCAALRERAVAQVAVVAVDDIAGGDVFDFAIDLFSAWGVGQARNDNGLGILLVKDRREIRFVTGGGLEGVLPDAICKRIQLKYMLPAFRQGDYSLGMVQGVEAVSQLLEGSELDLGGTDTAGDELPAWAVFLIVTGFVVVPMGVILLGYYARKRCPKCHKLTLRQQSSDILKVTPNYRLVEYTYVCSNCGAVVKRQAKNLRDDNFGGGAGGGMIIGGRGFGGFGGGSRGGGFGGGSFGGGGAGSRW